VSGNMKSSKNKIQQIFDEGGNFCNFEMENTQTNILSPGAEK